MSKESKHVLERLVNGSFLFSNGVLGCYKPKPGEAIARLSEEEREALQDLTSDEIADDRHPWYGR